ncbi:MAG: ElyC/SanA/YdcF family protein [Syntrophobacteraceae bacterium]|jgi:uncharacterized SAM-binding protein YcdF (DUF218 family)
MYHFKKIIAPFLFPVPLCIEILFLGLLLLWATRRQRLGKSLVTLGAVLLTVFSYAPAAQYLLKDLEYKYYPLKVRVSDVHWVVVLGSGVLCDSNLPIGNQIDSSGLFRLIEGVRLYGEYPGCKLLVSGGSTGPAKPADHMAGIALLMGVPKEDLVLEADSLDTEDEARIISSIVQGDRFILVTSASHMPRSMALFEKEGMHPVPAPSDYLVRQECPMGYPSMPGVVGLEQSTAAFYEYLGLAWLKLRGRI